MNEGRYDDALKYCNELIVVDFANSRRWSAKIAEINSKKEKAFPGFNSPACFPSLRGQ